MTNAKKRGRPNTVDEILLGALREAGPEGITLREVLPSCEDAGFKLRALEYAGERLARSGRVVRESHKTSPEQGRPAKCYRYRLP